MTPAKKFHRILIISLILTSVLFFAILSAGWYYVLSISKSANRINTETENLREEADALSNLAIKYKKVSLEQDLVLEAIPKEKDISSFLADFESLASRDNITIKNSILGDAKSKSKVGSLSQTTSRQNYLELPIRYEVDGSYANFLKFINDTNGLRRLNSISDLNITSTPIDTVPDKVKASFVIKVYLKQG